MKLRIALAVAAVALPTLATAQPDHRPRNAGQPAARSDTPFAPFAASRNSSMYDPDHGRAGPLGRGSGGSGP